MQKRILLLLFIFLTSCGSQAQTVLASPSPDLTTPTAAPLSITPTIENCAYVQATQNLPDATVQIDKAIKQLQPDANARAEAYGENCVYASNAQSTFSAMETDFYFTINVKNLKDDNELGTWIINTMSIVNALPAASIAGPQAGFVKYTFKTKGDQRILRISITTYKNLPTHISSADVIQSLFPNP
ncbi:MAG TPA: hypothetical protein VIN60_03685 [Anaerolineales bacterium]